MIDKKRQSNTMIDKNRVVLYCIKCGIRIIEDKSYGDKCPNCEQNTLVIDQNLLVQK